MSAPCGDKFEGGGNFKFSFIRCSFLNLKVKHRLGRTVYIDEVMVEIKSFLLFEAPDTSGCAAVSLYTR